uniref:3CxxC-type domain-containing protein n=1 Tax=Loxodonta africana TaxID=9785 RepID=G3TXK1_LOXAF
IGSWPPRRRMALDIKSWEQTFQELIQQEKPRARWTLKLDEKLQPNSVDQGWKQYKQRAFGSFQCSSCQRKWASAKVQVLYHMFLEPRKSQGTVLMRLFGQRCKKCYRSRFEKPEFSSQSTTTILQNLVQRVLERCYRGGIRRAPEIPVTVEVPLDGSHDTANCEACVLHICTWVSQSLETKLESGISSPRVGDAFVQNKEAQRSGRNCILTVSEPSHATARAQVPEGTGPQATQGIGPQATQGATPQATKGTGPWATQPIQVAGSLPTGWAITQPKQVVGPLRANSQATRGSNPHAAGSAAPQATQGSASQTTQGSAPQATQGSAPHITQGPAPQAAQGSHPQATQGPASQVPQGPAPQATQGSAPQAAQGLNPQVAGRTAPQATQGSHPRATQGPAPQTTWGPAPQATRGSEPQATRGLDPQAAGRSAPQARRGTAPQTTWGTDSQIACETGPKATHGSRTFGGTQAGWPVTTASAFCKPRNRVGSESLITESRRSPLTWERQVRSSTRRPSPDSTFKSSILAPNNDPGQNQRFLWGCMCVVALFAFIATRYL